MLQAKSDGCAGFQTSCQCVDYPANNTELKFTKKSLENVLSLCYDRIKPFVRNFQKVWRHQKASTAFQVLKDYFKIWKNAQ